ncbi:HAD family hydrolase [Halobacterium bonnevillei]|uniref:HAD hydrolase-like protein n=1 Tax=Halobacterium bonnevillei TaxID=2692200 RepID=A0A6B0SJN6_9EURY|nr:HAD hydrolase-like protein [Halobacterium bonnevillei]MXR19080.1 HAD hydrolase-like protein [Halobacterium bonnevillei]
MTLDVIVFDLDGTLVQLDFTGEGMQTVRSNLQDVFKQFGVEYEFRPLLVDLTSALEEVAEQTDEETTQRVRNDAFNQVEAMERDAVSRQHIYEDASTTVRRVAASDTTLAIATNNTREAAERAIDAANFPDPDILVAIDDVDKPKPDSEMINELIERLDSEPTSLAIVGDRPGDAESAIAACEGTGITAHTVLVCRDGQAIEDSEVVDDIVTSLPQAINNLF